MGRIRTIKPEFWQDEDLAFLDADIRLLALGLLNHSDDEGYFKAHPSLIKAAVFPFTDDSLNVHGMLKQLEKVGYLMLFQGSDGKQYGVIRNFTKHQKVNRPSPSKIKGFQVFTDNSLNDHGELTGGTGNREQGTGNREHKDSADESASSDYAFQGENFNVNQADFSKHKTLFPNLNLLSEYPQLDLEVRDTAPKQRWAAVNAKLNYRNKNAKPTKTKGFDLTNQQYESGEL